MVSGIELVIVIDQSTPMEILLSKFVDALQDSSPMLERRNVNVGLITFSDSIEGCQIFSHRFNGRDFTEKPMKVVARLREIEFNAPGSETTPSLEALMMTRSMNWPSSTNPRIIMLITDSTPRINADDIVRTNSCLESLNLDGLIIVTDTKSSLVRDQYLVLLKPERRPDLMYDINASEFKAFRQIYSMGLETVYYDPFEEER